MFKSNEIYFLGRNNNVYSGTEICKAVEIITGKHIFSNDQIRHYVKTCCAGIHRELSNTNVRDLVIRGATMSAMMLYRDQTSKPIKDCAKHIDEIKQSLEINGID